MSRRTKTVAVPALTASNRDHEHKKVFLITEWDAATAERWGMSMMLALNRSAGEIPMDLSGIGMEGVAVLGINTFLRGNIQAAEILPLLDQLLDCVQIVRDPKHPEVATALASPDDIEEVATRLWLRSQVIELHTGFSPAAALSAWAAMIMTKKEPDSGST